MNTKEYVEHRIKIINAQLDEPEVLNKGRISDKMEAYQEVLNHISKAENLPISGVVLRFFSWVKRLWRMRLPKCTCCDDGRIKHFGTDWTGRIWIEVYKCDRCDKEFV